ncbi:hypothetical protein CDAR_534641, partial [Caerostris darwini]
ETDAVFAGSLAQRQRVMMVKRCITATILRHPLLPKTGFRLWFENVELEVSEL